MYQLDHMLNGEESRNHLNEMIKQAKLAKLAQEARDAQEATTAQHNHNPRAAAPQHSLFTSVILMLTRGT